eukprot:CAMPEP_0172519394 /NCGR_PEP_ID=MMETSP1066-20121228/291388_1 /TAXON_ID=671091 /ORGANISM="Coscinodiscus wailesii, Strain CCMP2513" /LENGTH=520 /DNA_ID=CAMNT_0013301969 /DNA_START=854 /DNA_END=2417 /DNA_ORIENTATION=+
MMDLSCDYAVVDVVSVLGTEQNITQNVQKWKLDGAGVRKAYVGRNKQQKDIAIHDENVKETLAELHENGEDVVYLDKESLELAVVENAYVFVDFFAEWCWHCKALAPTWEALAELMNDVANELTAEEVEDIRHRNELRDKGALDDDMDEYEPEYTPEEFEEARQLNLPVLIAKVDCVEHKDYCAELGIRALPTLRLFVDGEPYPRDYDGDRTIVKMTNFLADVEHEMDGDEGHVHRTEEHARKKHNLPIGHEWRRTRQAHANWDEKEHPGCQVSGSLFLDRVPGNFHIRASSNSHTFMPSMTNVSHEVHHLSFGEDYMKKRYKDYGHLFSDKISPFNGNVYVTHHLHQAYHHHLKVVTTNFEYVYGSKPFYERTKQGVAYQILAQSQLSSYHEDAVPEAKFIYDLSPVAVTFFASSLSPPPQSRDYYFEYVYGSKPFYERTKQGVAYQILAQSQLSSYHEDAVPEAKFIYDLSPVAVTFKRRSKRWYDYLTSIMAIIGGAFTLFGMLESSIQVVTTKKRY